MACEDYPCCGHEPGCCPDFDPDTGEQLNMKCVCGATVPLNSRSSLCPSCLRAGEEPGERDTWDGDVIEDYDFDPPDPDWE